MKQSVITHYEQHKDKMYFERVRTTFTQCDQHVVVRFPYSMLSQVSTIGDLKATTGIGW